MKVEPRNICIMFAGIVDAARIENKVGAAEAKHALERCLNRMERAASAFKGRGIRVEADHLMAAFDATEDSLSAAGEMLQRVESLPPVSGQSLQIHIGIHYGPVLQEGSDFFGDAVNVALHIMTSAKPGQILTSSEAVAELPTALAALARENDSVAVKGRPAQVATQEIVWTPAVAKQAVAVASEAPPKLGQPRLRLRYRDQTVMVGADRPTVTLGRDVASDIIIRDARASRHHARVEFRRDIFLFVDDSTNGSYLTIVGQREVPLKKQEAVLSGQGRVAFGHARKSEQQDLLEFELLD